ncbi:jerky protein homolog-like [Parasteatoda tepidariorum]|uniref:jerky protein homolog-like n=1 Tax=Parasteatoda tepidariorum TaxID=114398 RepID=UPI0039BCD904
MTRDIFVRCFHKHFVLEVRKHLQAKGLSQKAVLLLDNASSHPNESLLASDNLLITGKFPPPNVTAAIQPMDQGVISAMKWLYRSELLKNLIHEVRTLPNFWKQYSLLDAVYGISAACILEQAKEIEGHEILDEENLEDRFQSDACEPGFQYLTDDDIATNCLVKLNSDDSIDAEDVANEGNTIFHSAALQSVEILLDYMGEQLLDYGDIAVVRKICVNIRQQVNEQQKQRCISHSFKQ